MKEWVRKNIQNLKTNIKYMYLIEKYLFSLLCRKD